MTQRESTQCSRQAMAMRWATRTCTMRYMVIAMNSILVFAVISFAACREATAPPRDTAHFILDIGYCHNTETTSNILKACSRQLTSHGFVEIAGNSTLIETKLTYFNNAPTKKLLLFRLASKNESNVVFAFRLYDDCAFEVHALEHASQSDHDDIVRAIDETSKLLEETISVEMRKVDPEFKFPSLPDSEKR